jgi:pimeloyl-ACP methyl ester carboxylesterase
MMEKIIDLSNGVALPYVEQGDPSGVPMILLHGFTDSWHSFERVLPYLPRSIHAFALTQRGHGDAESSAVSFRTRDFAADVAAFVQAMKLGPTLVVGHSMGSTHAQRFAIDYPEHTLGLVLAGAFKSYRDNPVVVDFWESSVSQLADPIDIGFVREFQESTLAQPIPQPFLDTVVRESMKVPARVWRAAFAGFLEDDCVAELGKIQASTLILWGAKDAFCPRSVQQALLTSIPGSQLVVYECAGHALHWEEPERFAADLATFAQRLSS